MTTVTTPAVDRLGDPGGVLFTLAAAKEDGLEMEEDLFDSYVYLLRLDGVLNFKYSFRFQPLPVSDLLREDIYNLTQAGYLERASPIEITTVGMRWLRGIIPWDAAQPLLRTVADSLASFSRYSRRELSKVVYARLTRPIPR